MIFLGLSGLHSDLVQIFFFSYEFENYDNQTTSYLDSY